MHKHNHLSIEKQIYSQLMSLFFIDIQSSSNWKSCTWDTFLVPCVTVTAVLLKFDSLNKTESLCLSLTHAFMSLTFISHIFLLLLLHTTRRNVPSFTFQVNQSRSFLHLSSVGIIHIVNQDTYSMIRFSLRVCNTSSSHIIFTHQ